MTTARIGIVGIGPRGLTVLERLVASERARKTGTLHVYIFDPKLPGAGCHDPDQADHLLVNTVAGQITLFSDATVVNAGPVLDGPSFYAWLVEDNQRKGTGFSPSPDAYYSRAQFGRYLHWVYHYLVALAPSHMSITLVRDDVLGVEREADGSWVLAMADQSYQVDYLILSTGHTKPARRAGRAPCVGTTVVVDDPYPIRESLTRISAGMTVGVEGMGLTTMDVISELTLGRGGRFVVGESTGQRSYLKSGREPRIVAYSRSGVPLTARAKNQKGISGQYKAQFLKADRIRSMRERGQLDFQADVLPLLWADMQHAYYETLLRNRNDPVVSLLFRNQFLSAATPATREAVIEQYVAPDKRLTWESLYSPVSAAALTSARAFDEWLMDHLRRDLVEARCGNLDSPLKAACDVVRDLRDNLRGAIDFGGLTEDSHRWLMSEFVPFMNRIAVGPPESRSAELLALIEAGVVNIGLGPGASCVRSAQGRWKVASHHWPERNVEIDVLVRARVSLHSPADDSSPLIRGLLSLGHARIYMNGEFHPGGIEIDRSFNLVGRNGTAASNAWALGISTEGPKFYTFVVPRPGVNSTAIVDAGRVVLNLLAQIRGGQDPSAQRDDDGSVPTTEFASSLASMYAEL